MEFGIMLNLPFKYLLESTLENRKRKAISNKPTTTILLSIMNMSFVYDCINIHNTF